MARSIICAIVFISGVVRSYMFNPHEIFFSFTFLCYPSVRLNIVAICHRNREAQSISVSKKRLPLNVRAVEFPAELIIIKHARESQRDS